MSISIVPYSERSEKDKIALSSFKPSTSDLNKLSLIVEEACAVMGIGVLGMNFAYDILRIEISGPKQDHLTLVDLPGLFHSSSKSQSDADKAAVFKLVGSYIERPRSVILAVVSAKNDIANQAVLNFAREHDPEGARTLGIITKPDTLPRDSPSEKEYIELAQNSNIKFALGWHVLRNRSFEENKTQTTTDQRDRTEKRFFEDGVWNFFDPKHKGIQSLRMRLSKNLYQHILGELPGLLEEVERGLRECKSRLQALGETRGTSEEQRKYLSKASQVFRDLLRDALDGNYTDSFFGSSLDDEGYSKRLCAVAGTILREFAADMRVSGHAIELVEKMPAKYVRKRGAPLKMSKENFYQQVQLRMRRNGGKELPGLYNPSIVADLFFDQARPWQPLVEEAERDLVDAAHTAVQLALEHSADETTIDGLYKELINPGMTQLEHALHNKAEEVLKPHAGGEVFTLNSAFMENIMAKREEKIRKDMCQRLHEFLGVNPLDPKPERRRYKGDFDASHLLDALAKQVEADTEKFAAIDCVNAMESYYKVSLVKSVAWDELNLVKVALKAVIDTFSMYAVKECFLSKIPQLFTPEKVLALNNKQVQAIAGESDESLEERTTLTKKLEALGETRYILMRLDRHKTRGRSCSSLLSGQQSH